MLLNRKFNLLNYLINFVYLLRIVHSQVFYYDVNPAQYRQEFASPHVQQQQSITARVYKPPQHYQRQQEQQPTIAPFYIYGDQYPQGSNIQLQQYTIKQQTQLQPVRQPAQNSYSQPQMQYTSKQQFVQQQQQEQHQPSQQYLYNDYNYVQQQQKPPNYHISETQKQQQQQQQQQYQQLQNVAPNNILQATTATVVPTSASLSDIFKSLAYFDPEQKNENAGVVDYNNTNNNATKTCNECCRPLENPCTSCCDTRPLLNIKTLKTIAG